MSVGMSLVRTLVDAVDRAGVPVEPYLAAAGLPEAALDDADGRVELPVYDRLGELAVAMTARPGLGLEMGREAPTDLHLVGQITAKCPTLRDALREVAPFVRLVADARPPRLVEEGDRARIVYEFVRSSPTCNRLRAEFGVTWMCRLARRFAGAEPFLLEAWFEHAAPPYAREYARVFEGTERFEMPETAIVFPRRLLDRPQRHHDVRLVGVLRERAEEAMRRLDRELTCAERLRDLVLAHDRKQKLSVQRAAAMLDLTPRTLQRRLAEEDTSFQAVVAVARAEMARRILAESQTSTQEAAFRMGFSDVSAFHRAFRRWTGMTPAGYRASLD